MTGDDKNRQEHNNNNNNAHSKSPPQKKVKVFKSGPSIMPAFVTFTNRTLRRIDVVWLNYEGIGVKYRTLDPNQFVDVDTYAGHPWIFRDSITGDKMVVHLKEVYEPVGWHPDQGPRHRKLVNITIPVYTLKERSLQAIRQLVPRRNVQYLDIPSTLKEELLEMHNSSYHVESNYEPSINHQQQQLQLQLHLQQYIQNQLQQLQPNENEEQNAEEH